MQTNKIQVVLVEDDARLRKALAEVLASSADCECTGVFANGKQAIAGIPPLKPDVVIQDINLPDLSGVECVAQLAPLLPMTRFIILTVYQDTETIFQALAAGAHGYLVKPVLTDKLLAAVCEIRAGGAPMSRTIARRVIEYFHQTRPVTTPAAPAPEILGHREQQVLEFLVAGFAYKEIAAQLDIKTSTVNTYVQRIYEKLHVRSRREIIALQKPGSSKIGT
jgi:DNA-binding NarL/FixJ family response regulator